MTAKSLKILIIDDFELVRVMLKSALKDLGYSDFAEAENGLEGWAKLEDASKTGAPFHIVLCDWNMPEMNGLEFLEKCRAVKKYKDLPIIIVTAEAEQEQIVIALKKGASDYIIKPFSPEMLEKKLKKAVTEIPA